MTTDQAFKHLTDQRGWYKLCGINPGTARSLKRHFKEGKMRSQHVEELLESAGYSAEPRSWHSPVQTSPGNWNK